MTKPRRVGQPTSTLPPLTRLAVYTTEQVRQSLQGLHHLYFQTEATLFHASNKLSIPGRNIPRSVHDTSILIPDSGYASAEEDEVESVCKDSLTDAETSLHENDDNESDIEAELIRADSFERSFVIKWLTGFIVRSDNWVTACDLESESEERSDVLDQAVTLLSAFTSSDEETEVSLTRTFSFPIATSSTSKKEIQVELNDAPLSNEDHTSVGLQSWGSSILLAERMCLEPSFFSLTVPIDINTKPLRILELGAGTGMLSIVTAKITQSSNPAPEIIATDYHPEVLDNLAKNVATNFSKISAITIKCLDWEVPHYSEPFDRPFDVILAADVIYHPEHARWIKQCVEKLLAQPSSSTISNQSDGGAFWLIIPVRSTGRHNGLDRTVDALFPAYTHEHIQTNRNSEPQLVILHKEEMERQGNVGRADESGYKLFKIGWIN